MRIKHNPLPIIFITLFVSLSTLFAIPNQKKPLISSNTEKGLWNGSKNIRIEDEFVLGKEYGSESEMFSYIRDIAIDQQDNLYVVDSMEICVKIFDKNGKFVRAFGREGQGPGEFQTIDAICWNPKDNILYIADRTSQRISLFSCDGEFKGSEKTGKFKATIDGIRCLNDGCFILTARIAGNRLAKHKIIVTTFDFDNVIAEIEEEFPIYAVGATISPKFSDVGSLLGERIYYTSPSEYEITVLNQEFQKQLTVTKSHPRMLSPHYVGGFYVDFNAIESILAWKDKFIVGVLSTQVKDIPRFKEKRELIEFVYTTDLKEWKLKTAYQLDFFNREFQFLGHVEIPHKRRLAGMDSMDRIYFVENDPFPRIICCQILIEEKS